MSDFVSDPEWLNTAQIAIRLGVSQRRVQQLIKDGYLPVIPGTTSFITSRETVSELIARRRSYVWRPVEELIFPKTDPSLAEAVEQLEIEEKGFDPDDQLMELYYHIGERIRALDPRLINQSAREDILQAGAQFAQALFRVSRRKLLV
jgi:DNA-binding GntR family transcriptional regulator